MARYALLIGNNKYDAPEYHPLSAPEDDVRSLKKVLDDPLIGKFDEVKPLINETCENTRLAIGALYAEKTKSDLLFLYFSGHGTKDNGTGLLSLVCRDTTSSNPATAISSSFILEQMNASGSAQQIVVLDNCYSGAFVASRELNPSKKGLVIITASSPSEKSVETPELKHGVFTYYFLKGLRGEADNNNDGVITVDEIFKFIKDNMPETQSPEMSFFRSTNNIKLAYNNLSVANIQNPILTDLQMPDFRWTNTPVVSFLEEYFGTSEKPVPFGGRDNKLKELDEWLEAADEPKYLLISMPSGSGKSALLAHWFKNLQHRKRSDTLVLYFPISTRLDTNRADFVFRFLNERLAWLHKEFENYQAKKTQNLRDHFHDFNDLLRKPIPNKKLLIILDGIDEAADWKNDVRILFPQTPPEHLRVVVAARPKDDIIDTGWLNELGWTEISKSFSLEPLDQEGIRDILIKLGAPLDQVAEKIDIVAELHKLSKGEPLVVKLYAQDLWEDRYNAGYLKPEELLNRNPGLEGYFKGWWQDQERLWDEQLSAHPDRFEKIRANVEVIRNLCTFAYGPLTTTDIWQLAQECFENTESVSKAIKFFERFLLKTEQGYIFSHTRLAEHFRDTLFASKIDEKKAWQNRFIEYGKSTFESLQAAVLTGRSLPEYSRYIVLHYSDHILEAKTMGMDIDFEDLFLLAQGPWKKAWENLQDTQRGFIDEIKKEQAIVSQTLEEELQRDSLCDINKIQRLIGEQIRISLCLSSFYSTGDTILIDLIQIGLQKKIFTPSDAKSYARHKVDPIERVRALLVVCGFLDEKEQDQMLLETLEIIKTIDAIQQQVALKDFLSSVPAFSLHPSDGILRKVVELILLLQMENQQDEKTINLLEKLLNEIIKIPDEKERAFKLSEWFPWVFKNNLLNRQFEKRNLGFENENLNILCKLTEKFPGETDALWLDKINNAWIGAESDEEKVGFIENWALYFPDNVISHILTLATKISNKNSLVTALTNLSKKVSSKNLDDFLSIVNNLDDDAKSKILKALSEKSVIEESKESFNWADINKLYVSANQIRVKNIWVDVLLDLPISSIQKCPSNKILNDIWFKLGVVLRDDPYRYALLSGHFLIMFPSKKQDEFFNLLLLIIDQINDQQLLILLPILMNDLPSNKICKLFDKTFDVIKYDPSVENQVEAYIDLLTHIPNTDQFFALRQNIIREFLDSLNHVKNINRKISYFLKKSFKPNILSEMERDFILQELLQQIRNISSPNKQAFGLISLAAGLPADQQKKIVQEALNIPVPYWVLVNLARMFPSEPFQPILDKIFQKMNRIGKTSGAFDMVSMTRKKLLLNSSSWLFSRMFEIAQSIRYETHRAAKLVSMFSEMPTEMHPDAIRACLTFKNKKIQAETFAKLAEYLTGEDWCQVCNIASNITPEQYRVDLLQGLAKQVPSKYLAKILAEIDNLQSWKYIVSLLKSIIVQNHLYGAIGEPEIQKILSILDKFHDHLAELDQIEIIAESLKRLKPGISNRILDKILDAIRDMKPGNTKRKVFIILAQYLSPIKLQENFELGSQVDDKFTRATLIIDLFSRAQISIDNLPVNFEVAIVDALHTAEVGKNFLERLEDLIAKLPEDPIINIIKHLQKNMEYELAKQVLLAGAPYISSAKLSELLSYYPDDKDLLIRLLPRASAEDQGTWSTRLLLSILEPSFSTEPKLLAKTKLLAKLVEYLPEQELKTALDLANKLPQRYAFLPLLSLSVRFTKNKRTRENLATKAFTALRVIKWQKVRAHRLVDAIPYFSKWLQPWVLSEVKLLKNDLRPQVLIQLVRNKSIELPIILSLAQSITNDDMGKADVIAEVVCSDRFSYKLINVILNDLENLQSFGARAKIIALLIENRQISAKRAFPLVFAMGENIEENYIRYAQLVISLIKMPNFSVAKWFVNIYNLSIRKLKDTPLSDVRIVWIERIASQNFVDEFTIGEKNIFDYVFDLVQQRILSVSDLVRLSNNEKFRIKQKKLLYRCAREQVTEIASEEEYASLLAVLAKYETNVPKMREILRLGSNMRLASRKTVLKSLASSPYLAQDLWEQIIISMQSLTISDQIDILLEYGKNESRDNSKDLYKMFFDFLQNLSITKRETCLGEIKNTIPLIFALGGEVSIRNALMAIVDTGQWWP